MPPDMELMLLNRFMWVLIAKLVFCLTTILLHTPNVSMVFVVVLSCSYIMW